MWALSLTSFFMDISSEMVINIIPLFLSNVLGVRINTIGIIEGVAEATASLLRVFSGWLSDKLRARKWIAVIGYSLSALSKPFFYFAKSWEMMASVRWADRVGKGVRTAPTEALMADSIKRKQRGLAFGFHRFADTAGATIGLLIATVVVWLTQSTSLQLGEQTFRTVVLISLIPAFMAVVSLAVMARDVEFNNSNNDSKITFKSLGKPFLIFIIIVTIFNLGNSSNAFLALRAQERGVSILGILLMLFTFNLIYALVSIPAGTLSDRIGRRRVIIGGWLVYGLIYFGFALAQQPWHIWILYCTYGLYFGLSFGTAKAMVADLVMPELRGTAYGVYNAVLGIIELPASLIAGILWQGVGPWSGFGPSAPFLFGGGLAVLAAIAMAIWVPGVKSK